MEILTHVSQKVRIVNWPSGKVPSTLMDPNSVHFQNFLMYCIIFLVLINIVGVGGQWVKRYTEPFFLHIS